MLRRCRTVPLGKLRSPWTWLSSWLSFPVPRAPALTGGLPGFAPETDFQATREAFASTGRHADRALFA